MRHPRGTSRVSHPSSGTEKAGKNWPVLFHIRVAAEECRLRLARARRHCLLFFSNVFLWMFLRLLFTFAIFCKRSGGETRPLRADSDPAAGMHLRREAAGTRPGDVS